MLDKIDEEYFHRGPYGIAITKKLARKNEVNPIWYVDITPGHDWLINPINDLINEAINDNIFTDSKISQITPFIDQMGDNRRTGGSLKEFWWEREWRHVGNFNLPRHVLILCPESDFSEFETLAKTHDPIVKCIDPNWGLEKIIARFSGFEDDEIDIF